MTSPSSPEPARPTAPTPWIAVSLGLNVVTLALVGAVLFELHRDRGEDSLPTLPEQLQELGDDVANARIELKNQADRIELLVQKLQREGIGGGASAPAEYDPDADLTAMSAADLVSRLEHVTEVLNRYRNDPLRREPIEHERGRIEEQLRARGDESIDAIASRIHDISDSWMQTRLLTQVVQPSGSDAANALAMRIFDDANMVAGVRLCAAQIALAKQREQVVPRLVSLLMNPEPGFDRREDVAAFFQQNPDERAVPALIALAKGDDVDRGLRRFVLKALGSYPSSPGVIDTLKEVAQLSHLGDLRAEALHSLHQIVGKDIVDFCRFLRPKLSENDPMRKLLDDLEAKYAPQ